MAEILPWGRLFAQNADGYILNDCHLEKISSPWLVLVEELRETCLKTWSNRLKSLYLRGSVPRGLAIPHVSDLDSFAILSGEVTAQDNVLARQISTQLKRRYLFCKKVELILLDETDLERDYSIWPSIIQIKSLKIAGADWSLNPLSLKPGRSLINYANTWEADLIKTLGILSQLSPDQVQFSTQVKKQCSWIMRRMVRAGFELVMEQDQSYTIDLYFCYQRFAVYFPEQKRNMRKALQLALSPSTHRPGLIIFLREFGRWLADRINTQLKGSTAPSGLVGDFHQRRYL